MNAQPVTDAALARRLLVEQLTSPVQWIREIEAIAMVHPDALYVEMGPGSVLKGLVKKIAPGPERRHLRHGRRGRRPARSGDRMKIDLTGRTALVTGSTRGIGRAIAETLTDAGARVAVVGRDQAKAAEVAAAIGGSAQGFGADVSDPASVVALVEAVEAAFGQIDILVNNAGLTRDNILFRIKDDDWDMVLDANLRGAFVAIRAAARGMMKRRWGRIINIASIVGITGNKGQANYAASKAGLIGLTKSVAKELGSRNILVNAVAPGFIETDMTAAMTPEARAALSGQIPLDRLGSPQDIAGTVAFLASEHAVVHHRAGARGGRRHGHVMPRST